MLEPWDTSTLGPVKLAPWRTLVDEIKAVLVSRPNPDDAARRILNIGRIARALAVLESQERGYTVMSGSCHAQQG